jgi:predicted nucleic acid-binding protein
MTSAVCDSGPLIHLAEAHALDLLQGIDTVSIPPAVEDEMRGRWLTLGAERPPWLRTLDLTSAFRQEALAWVQVSALQLGESEAIALARQERVDWLLTDDAAARLIAVSLGIEVHGSLGVVLWSMAVGRTNAHNARRLLDALFASSLWTSERVRREALLALERMSAGRGREDEAS